MTKENALTVGLPPWPGLLKQSLARALTTVQQLLQIESFVCDLLMVLGGDVIRRDHIMITLITSFIKIPQENRHLF